MQITTDDLADYSHRFVAHLADAMIKKGLFSREEIKAIHQDIFDTANGPRADAVRSVAQEMIRAHS